MPSNPQANRYVEFDLRSEIRAVLDRFHELENSSREDRCLALRLERVLLTAPPLEIPPPGFIQESTHKTK